MTSRSELIFPGHVTDLGAVILTNRRGFDEYAKSLAGQCIFLTLEPEPVKASDRQRKWWFGRYIPEVAEEAGYDRDERHGLHIDLLRECFGTHEKNGREIANRASWTQLSVKEAWELMEWAVRFAAKTWGVVIPFPSEMEAAVLEAIRDEEERATRQQEPA